MKPRLKFPGCPGQFPVEMSPGLPRFPGHGTAGWKAIIAFGTRRSLTAKELHAITGSLHPSSLIADLERRGWRFKKDVVCEPTSSRPRQTVIRYTLVTRITIQAEVCNDAAV